MKFEFDMNRSFYENVDPRRKQERADARKVSEDHNAMANLSNVAIHKTFDVSLYPEHLNMFDQSDKWKS